MSKKEISITTLRRLPVYLHYLNTQRGQKKNISASAIALELGLNHVQVRKDLAMISGSGRPKTGHDIDVLIAQLEECLGCNNHTKTILIGAGNLGKALLSYSGFDDFGLDIIAAFDADPGKVGLSISGKPILSTDDIAPVCRREEVKLGIIATPASMAQGVCDHLIDCGIRAVWNFAPTFLRAPEGILIENENLASSLAILSRHLCEMENEGDQISSYRQG